MLNLWTIERFEITCESSLLPLVPQFLKCKYAKKGQKAGRGKDDSVASHRAGTLIHTHTRQWVALIQWEWEPQEPEHPSHSAYAWEAHVWPQRSYSFQRCSWHLERGCSASHRLLSSSRAPHRASSHNSATMTKAPQQLWLLPSLLSLHTLLKGDVKGVPAMFCRYQLLPGTLEQIYNRVHQSKEQEVESDSL